MKIMRKCSWLIVVLQCWCINSQAAPIQDSSSMIAQAVEVGELVVGIAVSEPRVIQDIKCQWRGYDIEIANELGKDLGVRVRYVEML